MKKGILFALVTVLGLALAAGVAFAGNNAPPGPHYNLNIVGVSHAKTNTTMTGSNRHTIFVALGTHNDAVTTAIYLVQGPDFQVCDGNGFDTAYDCDGKVVGRGDGAVFQLPCNLLLPAGSAECGATSTDPCLVPCTTGDSTSYQVWARALGTPGGSATMTTCAYDGSEKICSEENTILIRNKRKSSFSNVTKELTSLVYYNSDSGRYERVALFQGDLEDWFWQYENKGLKLAQLRLYLIED